MRHIDYLIIGGGVAGTTAAETIRTIDQNGSVVIVSDEQHPLYSRVLLPRYVLGEIPRERVFLRTPAQYDKKDIELMPGVVVAAIRPNLHEVELDSGDIIKYGKLLTATGGRPRKPDPCPPGAHLFRTIDDADGIRTDLAMLAKGSDAAIIGGSFIALEFAPFFIKAGMRTRMLFSSKWMFERLLDEQSARIIEEVLTENGVEIMRGDGYAELVGGNRLESVRTVSGRTIPADIAGIGVGIQHDARSVNEYLETNAPDVWAAGDATYFYDVTVGRERHLGNWTNAMEQGRCAGLNMTGQKTLFHAVSSYSTSIFGLHIAVIGDVAHESGTEEIIRGDGRDRARILVRNGKVVGASLLGLLKERSRITQFIKDGKPYE